MKATQTPEEIRESFINTRKHNYIQYALYEGIVTHPQIHFLKELYDRINHPNKEVVFEALLHMQASLDIHDEVDLSFEESLTNERLKVNQLKVLVGDYHSSMFYRLLARSNELSVMYHLIDSIKSVNQSKMSILHSSLSDEDAIDALENIHIGLFNSLAEFFQIDSYKSKIKPQMVVQLTYERPRNFWIELLKEQNSVQFQERLNQRKALWQNN
ncbi:hypothetical protein CEY16_03610 [Halalkalibacillus sediminis]|uniref:Heptaprenyl diphosphate synthase n=1 Tax=Halalkalibacillus sediminis TaxID=2018042 RepID=A0A2I0QWY7_9BACI|nr:heptaprenyl diphosphate synthase component 1 [Halalkalibacillus sediminis]PKR78853.1 hypothetical protein CEY16_03610 [Halalkalibacillus sediminis]